MNRLTSRKVFVQEHLELRGAQLILTNVHGKNRMNAPIDFKVKRTAVSLVGKTAPG